MSKVSNIAATLVLVPVLAISTASAFADSNSTPGQIEQGDIYRVEDLTSNVSFADNINASCGDTVAFRVRVHNGGPATITNVKVAATLDTTTASTSHGSTVSISADNNLDNTVVTANAGVNTSSNTTATYVSGSTELLNYSTTPGGESVIENLPDGILDGGVNIGSIGPLTSDTEEVQFEAKLSCPTTPPVTPPTTPPTTTTTSKPTTLVNTGAGNTIGIFAAVSVVSGIAYRFALGRRLSRQ